MDIAERLKSARQSAGFKSAAEAAQRFDWVASTYSAHENGTRGVKPVDAQKYALAFRTDPCFLLFGTEPKIAAGINETVLREVIKFLWQHEGAKTAPPDDVADLVIELCHYVSKSGEVGLPQIVDFAIARRAAQGF